jgi:neutral ceramidase
MRCSIGRLVALFVLVCVGDNRLSTSEGASGPAPGDPVPVGVAVVDITPDYPIRMVGYESRKTESEGVVSRLKARALAIGDDGESGGGPTVLVAVDNCAVGSKVTQEVADRLNKKVGLKRERFAVCSTHTHCAPGLSSGLDFIYGNPLPPDQRARIDRYTATLTDAIETAALTALKDRAPASLAWGQGRAGFAANRRVLNNGKWVGFGVNPNGPVDPSLPVLTASDPAGKVRAVLFGYACHCTTLGGEFNKICAEWAGYACDEVERQSPGSVAVAIIGCGADANPEPRRNLDDAKQHGAAAAAEVNRLLAARSGLTPLTGRIACRFRQLELPLEPLPDRTVLLERAKRAGAEGFLARTLLQRLDRGETLPTTVPYCVQTWCFGDEMAMVFLAGEVVVDYAIRLKWEIDADRLWIVAYSNDVPSYIPSRRILSEGGYEADSSMIYYGHPSRYAPEVEDRIIQSVHDLLPPPFDGPRRKK